MFEIIKENDPSNTFLKFIHNFWVECWNFKQVFEDESQLHFVNFCTWE